MKPSSLAITLSIALAFAVPASGADAPSQLEARRLSDAFAAVAEKVSPSVVQIEVSVRAQNAQVARWYNNAPNAETAVQRGWFGRDSTDGAILTNNHVVDDALDHRASTRRRIAARGSSVAIRRPIWRSFASRRRIWCPRSSPTAIRCASASGSLR
jgi:S1-C subfamily serine protease